MVDLLLGLIVHIVLLNNMAMCSPLANLTFSLAEFK